MSRWQQLLLIFILLLLPLFPYGQVWHFSFLNLDDDSYISKVPQLLQGYSWESWRWAWTTADPFIMPVVRLALLGEIALFGLDSGWIHGINLFYHMANVLLLFALLHRLTGDFWRSWLAAAWFALHPQHVEAVAWAAERKEVMSGFFGLLSLWCYVSYSQISHHPRRWYGLSLLFLLLSLLCKPMWVTMPVLLLLLDYWPLQRYALGILPLLREKVPFLLVGMLVSFLTLFTFHQGGHLTTLQVLPLVNRLSNVLAGYVGYVFHTLWPVHLGLPYRASSDLPEWTTVAGQLLLLGMISWLAWYNRRRYPMLWVGWGWFLVTILPVSGLLEGGQPLVMADRRSYVPHMLLLPALVWLLPMRKTVVTGAMVFLLISGWLTADYASRWRDSITLWSAFISQNFEANFARWALSLALADENRLEEAITTVHEAHRQDPMEAVYIRTLADLLEKSGKNNQAWQVRQFLAQTRSPTTLQALKETGLAAFAAHRHQDAILLLGSYWQKGQEHNPLVAYALGVSLHADGQQGAALELWQDYLREEPLHRMEKCRIFLELSGQTTLPQSAWASGQWAQLCGK
ncbi:MAG: hypothetical protein G8345_17305 [Magnetococcales bacterium]|nr:hypothetical protein [Magnetococcales bacterium]